MISSPAKAWAEINTEEDRRKVLGTFVYPMIGLCGLSVFIGTFIGNTAGVSAFQIAMTRCCAIFVSLFGGYFLAAYAVNQLGKKLLNRGEQYELNQQFVGYAMVVTFVLDIISGLFSISILHWILQFYTVFVVYEGARTLMKVEEAKLTRYTLIASVIVIVCPALIAAVFNELSVTKVSHPLKHQLFSFSFVCLPPYPLTVNTCLTEVMQTIHILRPIFPTLQPLQGFCSSLCRFR